MATVRNRAIVQFEGLDTGVGRWSCSKDISASNCAHINSARQLLQHTQASDQSGGVRLQYDPSRIGTPRRTVPVSYLARPPPIWACLTDEEQSINRFHSPEREQDCPKPIPLPSMSACTCNRGSTADANPFMELIERECTVYGLSHAWKGTVMVQKCGLCQRRMIGPDCRELGLFNYNNSIIVAESLLDDFTSMFIGSETPFVAYAAAASRRYETHSSPIPFLSEKLFREIWFGYVVLVDLNLRIDGMCPKCGPVPETTIWDGVTVAFSQRYLQASLEPPTVSSATSATRANVKYIHGQQCIEDKNLRRQLRQILHGPSLFATTSFTESTVTDDTSESESDGADTDTAPAPPVVGKQRTKAKEEELRRLRAIPRVLEGLQKINHGLAATFNRWFGISAISACQEPPSVYTRLFKQIVAEESVLQMMNRPALHDVAKFLSATTTSDAAPDPTHLISVPVFYDVAQYELDQFGGLQPTTRELFHWAYTRGYQVVQTLLEKNGVPRKIGRRLGVITRCLNFVTGLGILISKGTKRAMLLGAKAKKEAFVRSSIPSIVSSV
ncbi:hypothetical protein CC1G_08330 [Coprinopsis cinerea okayama7|uniref:HMG domain-containing protein n=1 Tax=Coprinopsis cinerea (strain Okayama-7 / 130 / ATCC MYA-4618 / FGSC 9003) TaxID=240176 RepID=A8NA71_COPC7|nr:hypothetical protein CC1G_08330 [Coprinopsis cinerea okayama7\|eukprot:XP_001831726.2 hypothetical protein CC1G_08330 [Coprinopsis cinerea okayama7\